MLSLRNLRYFQTLARMGHFGRAADACSVTQPALSMQIRELETHLGTKLFERVRDGARLTEAGREALGHADRILGAVADLEAQARSTHGLLSGPFRLGVIPSVAPYLLPRLLPAVMERVPNARLTLRETLTATLVEELLAGDLDAIIASLPLDRPDLTERPLFDDPFMLAVAAKGAFATADAASQDMLSSPDLLLLEDGHCFRDQALEVCRTLDAGRLRSYGATSLSTLVQLVANGQGITLLPKLFVTAEAKANPRVKLLHFPDPEPARTIGLAWRRSASIERDVDEIEAAVRAALAE
ncbi:LysR family transcriptional regulator [Terrihabitans soli]|uniref:LysR family transcriptional regulator n=1 Tax=Terrihabitans soli TaxID=708113 RepID=A0A6S6QNY8_9HYPH|nr:hydrogen peroxide-inducible genes activator [Terrihabitans soli]BCJ91176.1 LysR family transcriptional regulator [Terrihabitans soli]